MYGCVCTCICTCACVFCFCMNDRQFYCRIRHVSVMLVIIIFILPLQIFTSSYVSQANFFIRINCLYIFYCSIIVTFLFLLPPFFSTFPLNYLFCINQASLSIFPTKLNLCDSQYMQIAELMMQTSSCTKKQSPSYSHGN